MEIVVIPNFVNHYKKSKMEQQNQHLTLEQQFNIRSFESQVQQMSREQAQEFLVKLYEQMLTRENMYQDLIKHQWGIE